MQQLTLDLNRCPPELQRGLAEIQAEYPHRFGASGALPVVFVPEKDASGCGRLAVKKTGEGLAIHYSRTIDAYRALGRLMGACETGKGPIEFVETSFFEVLGVMVDVSRNGVLLPAAAKALMRRYALMGINMIMLYAEDTYEVPGEPFFGYLRGRYSQDELKTLDETAACFGIEMFPCIQTLAHLAQILQWPAYADYRDTDSILLAGDEKTYQFIEKIIRAASAPFRSRRIHLGMDEAHGIGTGRYRQRFGEQSPFEILNQHLARVRSICLEAGLKPMIWSDMYFRLGSKTHGYYDRDCVIPPEVVERIPRDVELVYWDYYHTEPGFYAEWINRHRALGSEPVMAGGIWTWNHFWAALPFSLTVTEACMTACKQKRVRQAFVTMWGDDGMECDVFSSLPGVQFFAEHGYGDVVDADLLRRNFRGSCNADFDAWMKAAEVDSIPPVKDPSQTSANVAKWLLWQDPLIGLMDPQIDQPEELSAHYRRLAETLRASAERTDADRRLLFPARLSEVLGVKCVLRHRLADAYRSGDRSRLRELVKTDLASLRRSVDELWRAHRDLWLSTYKPFGLEVLEHRYGGLRTRLESLSERLTAYAKGGVESIPELETRLERIYPGDPGQVNSGYARVASPSVIWS